MSCYGFYSIVWTLGTAALVGNSIAVDAALRPDETCRVERPRSDAACWTDYHFLELCCSGSAQQGADRGCWDHQFNFDRCCGGREWTPEGYGAWLQEPVQAGEHYYEHCAEFVKSFDFGDEDVSSWKRFTACVQNRLTSVRSAFRPPMLVGQHYPTVLTPGPLGLVFATPANDFVVSKHLRLHGTFDAEELSMYKELLPVGAIVVDVGANIGSYAIPLAVHVGRTGLVVAVEPFQALFQMLTANSAINGLRNLRTKQVGLGAVEERVRAHGPTLENFNNVGMARVFRQFDEKYAETFHYRSDSEEETIDVTTLDRLVEREGLKKLSLLKVDVEGHLKAVLEGGQETLRRLRPIVVAEHSDDDALERLQTMHHYQCIERLPQHSVWVCSPL